MRRSLFPQRNYDHEADKALAKDRPSLVEEDPAAYGAYKRAGETESDVSTRPPDRELIMLLRGLLKKQDGILTQLGSLQNRIVTLEAEVHELGVKVCGGREAGGHAILDEDIPF